MHLTLKQETANPPAANKRAQQRRFNEFRQIFNDERPHEAPPDWTRGPIRPPMEPLCAIAARCTPGPFLLALRLPSSGRRQKGGLKMDETPSEIERASRAFLKGREPLKKAKEELRKAMDASAAKGGHSGGAQSPPR